MLPRTANKCTKSTSTHACNLRPDKRTRLYCSDDLIVVAFNACNSLLTRIVSAAAPDDVSVPVRKLSRLNQLGTCVLTARHQNGEITATTRRQGLQDCVMAKGYVFDIGIENINCYDIKIGSSVKVNVVSLEFVWYNSDDVGGADNIVLLCDEKFMVGVSLNGDGVPVCAWVTEHMVSATSCIGLVEHAAVFAYNDDILALHLKTREYHILTFDKWLPASSSEKNTHRATVFRSNGALGIQYGCHCGVVVMYSGAENYMLHLTPFAPTGCLIRNDGQNILRREDGCWFQLDENSRTYIPVALPACVNASGAMITNSDLTIAVLDRDGMLHVCQM